tara:strand:- start:2963 stop:3451 length:489 start_codon:yes stop_codon:yes gene_type:complete
MKYKCLIAYLLAFLALPQVAIADILAILINPDSLSYDLSSGNYANSPGNYANSSGNYENSEGNYANSPGNYANSAGNYANGINGENRIISEDNLFLGYYVFSDSGVMNLYSASGNRVAYMPSGGHTQSLFFSQGGWCGTIGESGGKTVLGLTRNCHLRFTLD